MLCTNGSTTVGTGIGWLHKWCINKPPWSIELTCRQRICAAARGVARSWRAACNPTRENFVMKTIFDCNLLFLCVRWGFFLVHRTSQGCFASEYASKRNEQNKNRRTSFYARLYCLKTKSVVKYDRLINIMNAFNEPCFDLRAVHVILDVSAKRSNVNAKCST